MIYNFNIFYVDRLLEDKSNQLDIQSAAIDSLREVVMNVSNDFIECKSATFTTFNERFNDSCAGAYVSVSFVVDMLDCEVERFS